MLEGNVQQKRRYERYTVDLMSIGGRMSRTAQFCSRLLSPGPLLIDNH